MRVPGRTLSIVAVAAAMTVGLVAAGLAQDATPTAMGGDIRCETRGRGHGGRRRGGERYDGREAEEEAKHAVLSGRGARSRRGRRPTPSLLR